MKQYAKELHKPIKKKFQRIRVITFKPNEIWGADLADMAKYKDGDFRYILVVIDIYSRYAWGFPLKTKKGDEVAKAFGKIKKKPDFLWVDKGSEFYNEKVKEVLKGTTIYSTESGMKSAFTERLNRTLKNKMFEMFTEKQSREWVGMLPELLKDYNNTVHRSTGKTPYEVYVGGEKPEQKFKTIKRKLPKFKKGDYVRISKVRGVFDKGYEAGWTEEVFKIVKVNKTKPPTYDLEDLKGEEIKGKFYEEEMQKTDLQDFALVEKVLEKKGNKVLVKYVGYGEKFNEWISKNQLEKLKK